MYPGQNPDVVNGKDVDTAAKSLCLNLSYRMSKLCHHPSTVLYDVGVFSRKIQQICVHSLCSHGEESSLNSLIKEWETGLTNMLV